MSNDWKEALEELENGYEPAGVATDYAASIIAHIEGLETDKERLRSACDKWSALDSLYGAHQDLIARAEAAEARVRELEIELDARVNQQVSAGTREKLVSARDKLDGDEWRAICGMFIEADNVARGCREYARELEAKVQELEGLILQLGERDN